MEGVVGTDKNLHGEFSKGLGLQVASLVDLVTVRIRELIITGEYRQGQQLKEDELCRMFAISRPPIREAFKTLEANGLVVRKPRRGVFVAEFTARDIDEVYSIVAMIYRKATELAIPRLTQHHIKQMEVSMQAMVDASAVVPANIRGYQLAHRSFHELILTLAGNLRMRAIEEQLRYQIYIISYKAFQDPGYLLSSLRYHQRILDALRKRDREQAMNLVEDHVLDALTFFVGKLENYTDLYSS
jgi:DNA-binding GntR family transcriptional regulator